MNLVKPTPTFVTPTNELRYDYEQVAEADRRAVMGAAVEIKAHADRAKESMIKIGQKLGAVKALLPHGQFGDWCKTEFEMTDRTARNMMAAAEVFGSKTETVSILSDSAMYLLSGPSVPEAARDEVIAIAQQAGASPTKATVKAVINKYKPLKPTPAPDQAEPSPELRTLDAMETMSVVWKALKASPISGIEMTDPQRWSQYVLWLNAHGAPGDYRPFVPEGAQLDMATLKNERYSIIAELRRNIESEERRSKEAALVTCPKCSNKQEDVNGFGIVHCKKCGHCPHHLVDGYCETCGMFPPALVSALPAETEAFEVDGELALPVAHQRVTVAEFTLNLPDDLPADKCSITPNMVGKLVVRYGDATGSLSTTVDDSTDAIAWLRREHERHLLYLEIKERSQATQAAPDASGASSAPGGHPIAQPDAAASSVTAASRKSQAISEMLTIYMRTLAFCEDFGRITGRYGLAQPLRRALEPMIAALRENQI